MVSTGVTALAPIRCSIGTARAGLGLLQAAVWWSDVMLITGVLAAATWRSHATQYWYIVVHAALTPPLLARQWYWLGGELLVISLVLLVSAEVRCRTEYNISNTRVSILLPLFHLKPVALEYFPSIQLNSTTPMDTSTKH